MDTVREIHQRKAIDVALTKENIDFDGPCSRNATER